MLKPHHYIKIKRLLFTNCACGENKEIYGSPDRTVKGVIAMLVDTVIFVDEMT